jgi:hypothetical protein
VRTTQPAATGAAVPARAAPAPTSLGPAPAVAAAPTNAVKPKEGA